MGTDEAKLLLRRRLLTARWTRPEADRMRARAAIEQHVLAACGIPRGLPDGPSNAVRQVNISTVTQVAAFLPLPTEPLSTETLDRLTEEGVGVLVPVAVGAAPMDWCRYPCPVTTGSLGIAEPLGRRLGPGALLEADVAFVPALAVDAAGHRLGRGGGHYDRTLAQLPASNHPRRRPRLIAVVFDDEVLPEVPFDELDQGVDAVLTPEVGIRNLGGG